MEKILFASDLDKTLLFSYKHRQERDICVEHLEGKEQSFMTEGTPAALGAVNRALWFVPVTSRSIEQYQRITFPVGCTARCAVTTNGGILLIDGRVDEAWRQESLDAIEPWRDEVQRMHGMLGACEKILRFRIVDGMYLFAACEIAADAQACGAYYRDKTPLDVEVSGRKVYFFPPPINKGNALDRLKSRFSCTKTICAGDSVIDTPMLCRADVAIVPGEGIVQTQGAGRRFVFDGVGRFPDYVLTVALAESRGISTEEG